MENKQAKQTKFDSMVTNKTMQLVKAVIPYIDRHIGNMIGILIKFQELQNAARMQNNVFVSAMNSDKHHGMQDMFEDIKEVLSGDERETIDMILSMMEMMNMDNDTKSAFMGNYMDMFNGDMFGGNMFGGDIFGSDLFGSGTSVNNTADSDTSDSDKSDSNISDSDKSDNDVSGNNMYDNHLTEDESDNDLFDNNSVNHESGSDSSDNHSTDNDLSSDENL